MSAQRPQPTQGTGQDESDHHALAASNRIALTTRTGFEFTVRPVEPFDEPALGRLFTHVGEDDMRFRFLSAMKAPGHEMLRRLVDVDHDRKEDYLAIAPDSETIIASALVATDTANDCAEVAIAMHRDYKHHGVGWTLLEFIIEQEKEKGVKKLQSIESRANHEAIELERQMGFKASSYPGDATLVLLEFDLTQSRQ